MAVLQDVMGIVGLGEAARGLTPEQAESEAARRAAEEAERQRAGTRAQQEEDRRAAEAARLQAAQRQMTSLGQAGQAATQQQQLRQQQRGAIEMLRGAATGQVPSAAELQQRAGLEQALRGQMAASVSGAGRFNPALAARQSTMAGEQLQRDVLQQAAMLRAQEQAGARGALVGALQGARGLDVGREQALQQLGLGFGQQALGAQQLVQAGTAQRQALLDALIQERLGLRGQDVGLAGKRAGLETGLESQLAGGLASGLSAGLGAA